MARAPNPFLDCAMLGRSDIGGRNASTVFLRPNRRTCAPRRSMMCGASYVETTTADPECIRSRPLWSYDYDPADPRRVRPPACAVTPPPLSGGRLRRKQASMIVVQLLLLSAHGPRERARLAPLPRWAPDSSVDRESVSAPAVARQIRIRERCARRRGG